MDPRDLRDLTHTYQPSELPVPPDRTPVPSSAPVLPEPPGPPPDLKAKLQSLRDELRKALAALQVPGPNGEILTLSDLEAAVARLPDPEAQAIVQAWQAHFASPDLPLAGWLAPLILEIDDLAESARRFADILRVSAPAPEDLSPMAQEMAEVVLRSLPHTSFAAQLSRRWNEIEELVGRASDLLPSPSRGPAPIFNWTVVIEEIASALTSSLPDDAPSFPRPSLDWRTRQLHIDAEAAGRYGQAWAQAVEQALAIRRLVELILALALRYVSLSDNSDYRAALARVAQGLYRASTLLMVLYRILAIQAFQFRPPAQQIGNRVWREIEEWVTSAIQSLAVSWLRQEVLSGLMETFAFFAYSERDPTATSDVLHRYTLTQLQRGYQAVMDRVYSLLGQLDHNLAERARISRQQLAVAEKLQALSLHIRVLREMGSLLESASRRGLSPAQIRAGVSLVIERILQVYGLWSDPKAREVILRRSPPGGGGSAPEGSEPVV